MSFFGARQQIKSRVDRPTAATGGPGSRSLVLFDRTEETKCKYQEPEDWKSTPLSDRLWVTAFDGEVKLGTRVDGTFARMDGPPVNPGGPDLINVNTATAYRTT